MHDQVAVDDACQRLPAQPAQQFVAIRCVKDVVQRVALARRAYALRHRQQVQVMIAQHAQRAFAEGHQPAQRLQRCGAAIDNVADENQLRAG